MNERNQFANVIGVRERQWLMRLLLVLAAGLLFARLGPFGTFRDLGPGERLSYWVGLTLLQWLVSLTVLSALQPLRLPKAAALFAAALLAALPVSFAVAWAEMLLRVERDLGVLDLLAIAGDVASIGVPLLLATHLRAEPTAPPPPPIESRAIETILAQVPPERRGRLFALEAEDHYVRVHTERGTHLLLMRFGDAVAAMPDDAGCQVHRGWWVARDAIDPSAVATGRAEVALASGQRVPVSRTYVRAARDAGLLR